jgi:hypothetical protein
MVLLEKSEKEVYLEEIEVDGRTLLICLFKFEWKEVKVTGLSQDGDTFCAFLSR